MKKLTNVPNRSETVSGFIFLAIQLLALQPALLLVNLLLPTPMSESTLNFLFFTINFISVAVIFRKYLIRSGKTAISAPFSCLRSTFLALVGYWGGNMLVSILIQNVYPEFFNVNDSSLSQMTQENFSLMAFGTILLAPVTEEVLYRGLIFGKLYNRSPLLAYFVSTLCFSALHVTGYIGMYAPFHLLLCLLQYVPAGLCLGWAYAKSDTIWAPILLHITVNQIAIFSMR